MPTLRFIGLLCVVVVLLVSGGSTVSGGVIPSPSQESRPSICDKHKVVCDPGWRCQAGFLLFPTLEGGSRANCDGSETDAKDCAPSTDPQVTMDSLEVFCVRDGHLSSTGLEFYSGQFYEDFKMLSALRQRHRRGACVEMCSSNAECSAGEVCISNGCGHVCAVRP